MGKVQYSIDKILMHSSLMMITN